MNKEKLIIPLKRPKGDDGYHTFSVRIKEEIFQQLESICQQTGHSRNELIGLLLSYALENCEIERQSHVYPYFREAMQCHLQTSPPPEKE